MVWERVAKFESGALYAEMYLRQNQSRGNREKKREERLGGRETEDPSPPLPELRQIKGRDEEEDSTEEKKERKSHETDR